MNKKNVCALGFGLLAAVLYFSSLAGYAFPGESASLIAQWRGLDPLAAPRYPLMAVFAKLFGGGNLIAPVCGAVAVALLFRLISGFVEWRVVGEKSAPERERLSLIAGGVAALVFALTPAVRSAATHLEPRLFDFTWALAAFALAIPLSKPAKNLSWLYAIVLGAMTAVGMCDSALFLAFVPFGFALLYAFSETKEGKPWLSWFFFTAVTVIGFFVSIRAFGMETSEYLTRFAKEMSAWYSVPGWLFVVVFATLPFVTSLFASNKGFNEETGLVQWIFHASLSFVAILAVSTALSPSSLMQAYGVLPVATSAFAAVLCGYLGAYWWFRRSSPVAMVAGGLLGFVLLVTCGWNLFTFDGEAGAFADKVAEKVLKDLGDRKWFVTDGLLDNHIKLVAADTGKDVTLICLAKDLDTDYLDLLSTVVEEKKLGGSKNAQLRLSLSLGVLPFLQDWFSGDPSVKKEVAIWGAPDIWYSARVTPVPEFLFFGADEKATPDWSAWKEFDRILAAPKGWGSYRDRRVTDPVERLRYALRRHVGFVANNRGVWLQDQKKDDEAWTMYELVLESIDRDNICAIFNEVGMIGSKHSSALAKQLDLERMLKAAVDDTKRRYLLWRLGTYYGYIRNPDTFIRLGHAWARSGRPGDALAQIRRAIDFIPTDRRSSLLNMMAALYANENDQQKSRRIWEAILHRDADNHDALVGMMRLELLDGNSTRAAEYLQRAARNTKDGRRAKIELAMVSMIKNDLKGARDLIRQVVDADAKDQQALSLLAAVTMQMADATKDEKLKAAYSKELEDVILPQMEAAGEGQNNYYVYATRGFLLLRKGKESRRDARDAFLAASKARPDVVTTQDLVLGLDISLDDKVGAEAHARDVLRRNRSAPLANYVMGSLALGRGRMDEAEAFLRRAADAPQPVILALNDLAETLRRRHDYSEAERYARKATELAPQLYVAWDTLGTVLMDANKDLDEAEAAIRKACDLSKEKDGREADIRMLISLARVQLKRGDRLHAKVTIRKVKARASELSDFEKHEFEEITGGVR